MGRVQKGYVKVHRLLAMQKAATFMQRILATGSILCNPNLKDMQTSASCGSRSRSWLNQAHADKFLLASGSRSSRALTTDFRRGLGVYNALNSQLDLPHPSIDQDAYSLGRLQPGKALKRRISEGFKVFLNGAKETSMMAMSREVVGKTSPNSFWRTVNLVLPFWEFVTGAWIREQAHSLLLSETLDTHFTMQLGWCLAKCQRFGKFPLVMGGVQNVGRNSKCWYCDDALLSHVTLFANITMPLSESGSQLDEQPYGTRGSTWDWIGTI